MKKIILFTISLLSALILSSKSTYAMNTGTGNYGNNVADYTIFHTQEVYEKGTRIPLWIGGTDTYTYYTYYIYSKLKIGTAKLNNNSFNYVSNTITGSYSEILSLKQSYEASISLSWEVVNGASAGVTLSRYQSWEYRYTEGEEIVFNLENLSGYASTSVMTLQMKVVERVVKVTKKYGGFSGTDLISTTVSSPTHKDYFYVIDYDVMPVFYNQLSTTDRNKFTFSNGVYTLKLGEVYNPNYNQIYYNRLPSELREFYYY